MQAEYGRDLTEADQVFIDAIFAHNMRQPPRPPGTLNATCANPKIGNLRLLRSVLALLDADFGYDDWLRVAAGVFNETGGSAEGLELFDSWSSGGIKYKGPCEIRSKWNSFHLDHPRPVTMATLRRMVEAKGYDWLEVCAAAEDGFDDIADDTEGVA